MSTDAEVSAAAMEVVKYWRDWPQPHRDAVRDMSQFLAGALEELSVVAKDAPRRGACAVCDRVMALTKHGMLRHHNGNVWIDGWRQVCDGSGAEPRATRT